MRASLLGAALAALLAGTATAQDADLILWGGTIHTGDATAPTAEAVAVEDGRIVFVGVRAMAEEMRGPDTEVVDLRGATMFPGFTDGHAHLRGIGEREMTLNLDSAGSLAEAMAQLTAWAEAHPGERVIWGRGWIETHWPEGRTPTRADLDAAAPGRAVALVRADGHALVASSAALDLAGVTRHVEPAFGGEIQKDAEGEPTGVLIDAAMGLLDGLRPQADPARVREAYRVGAALYAARGWAGVHNMSVPIEDVPVMTELAAEGALPLRVYNAVTPEGAEALFETGPRFEADGRVITRAVKVYADGALGSRGAALFEPYADRPDTTGLMQIGEQEIVPLYQQALRSGIQIATHAIGDRGNAETLDWYDAALKAVPAGERPVEEPRFRVEHAQVLRLSDIPRFRALGVIPSMQPSHAIGDLFFAPSRLGDARLDGAYAWRRIVESGAILPGGSDAPVERGDPLIEFYAAVARKSLDGRSGPDWRADQAVDRKTALKMFTTWPAYASFREGELGLIKPGYRADFSGFSVDLMKAAEAEIPKGRAVLTVVDGVVVYSNLQP